MAIIVLLLFLFLKNNFIWKIKNHQPHISSWNYFEPLHLKAKSGNYAVVHGACLSCSSPFWHHHKRCVMWIQSG